MTSMSQADELFLPTPGTMVHLSPAYNPPVMKGIRVHPDNPFRLDFIVNQGSTRLNDGQLKQQSSKLIKYFLASLTIPEKDLWVNLSPYEKDRIIPQSFGLTEMGRDLLAEDYILKQITASLIYPEDQVGKKFWKRVYEEAQRRFGTTDVPVNTFNKVWIVPQKAVVYENAKAGTAYIVESKLKVMLEQDYLSLEKHAGIQSGQAQTKSSSQLGSQIIRAIIIPELNLEVNENKNFAHLRQVYNSLILATWYKKKIKDSILEQVYADKNKVAGVQYTSTVIPVKEGVLFKNDVEGLYKEYLKAFKKGVYNYIKEQVDPVTQQTIPRKYFSGGVVLGLRESDSAMKTDLSGEGTLEINSARMPTQGDVPLEALTVNLAPAANQAPKKNTGGQYWRKLIPGTMMALSLLGGASSVASPSLQAPLAASATPVIHTDNLEPAIKNLFDNGDVESMEKIKGLVLTGNPQQSQQSFLALMALLQIHVKSGNGPQFFHAVTDIMQDKPTLIQESTIDLLMDYFNSNHSIPAHDLGDIIDSFNSLPDSRKDLLPKVCNVLTQILTIEEPYDPDTRRVYGNAFSLVQRINKINPGLVSNSPVLTFVASLNLNSPEADLYANYRLYHYQILTNAYFKSVAVSRNLSLANKNSVAIAVFRLLRRNHLKIYDKSIHWAVDTIIQLREKTANRIVFRGKVLNVLYWGEDARKLGIDEKSMRDLEMKTGDHLGPEDITSYIGKPDKQRILNYIAEARFKGPRTLFFNGHGDPNFFHLSDDIALAGQDYFNSLDRKGTKAGIRRVKRRDPNDVKNLIYPGTISYMELAYAEKAFEDHGGNLNEDTIDAEQCFPMDYALNLLNAMEALKVKRFPEIIVANDLNELSLARLALDRIFEPYATIDTPLRNGDILRHKDDFMSYHSSSVNTRLIFIPIEGNKFTIPNDLERELGPESPVAPHAPGVIEIGRSISPSSSDNDAAMGAQLILGPSGLGEENSIAQSIDAKKGGIDLTPANMNLQTQNIGGEIKFRPDAAMLQQLQDSPGFTIGSITVQPLKSLTEFLGVLSSKVGT